MTEQGRATLSPPARRITTPSWLDLRLVLGVALVLASILTGAAVMSAARRTEAVLAARRDLGTGTVLAAGDVQLVPVRLSAAARVYVRAVEGALGKRLARPLSAGELVPLAALETQPEQTTLTVPLGAASAPDLRKGDRIELWFASPGCASTVLLPEVTVQGVRVESGAFGSRSGAQDVTIGVAPDLAERVVSALALDGVQLRAGIRTGTGVPWPPTRLADPAGCAAGAR